MLPLHRKASLEGKRRTQLCRICAAKLTHTSPCHSQSDRLRPQRHYLLIAHPSPTSFSISQPTFISAYRCHLPLSPRLLVHCPLYHGCLHSFPRFTKTTSYNQRLVS